MAGEGPFSLDSHSTENPMTRAVDPDPRRRAPARHSRRRRAADPVPRDQAAPARIPHTDPRLGAHRDRHRAAGERDREHARRGLRINARLRGAADRTRSDPRAADRVVRRCQGRGRPDGPRLRREARGVRPRHHLAAARLPDLLRRRPGRHAADHLRRRSTHRRQEPAAVRHQRRRGVLGHARVPSPAPRPRLGDRVLRGEPRARASFSAS